MKFVCEHSIPVKNKENRYFTLSSNDKLDYVISVINACGEDVEIISASYTTNKAGFFKSRIDRFSRNNYVISAPTFGTHSSVGKVFQRIFALCWLTWYLLSNCHRKETVFVYHSVATAFTMLILEKIKKIKIVNEVEELFYQLSGIKNGWRIKLEKKIIAKSCAFIFASNELNSICNKNKKPYIVINGNYNVNSDYVQNKYDAKRFVYAGLIEVDKVAFKCLNIAMYLPMGYEIHIIGYGNKRDIECLIKKIEIINSYGKCKVFYDGIKRDEEYIRYLQQFKFGLCPLTSNSSYQNACFPSKISSYMANGINVITTANTVLKNSAYGPYINFVKDDNPKSFAEMILGLNEKNCRDTKKIVKKLDVECKRKMRMFLKGINNK